MKSGWVEEWGGWWTKEIVGNETDDQKEGEDRGGVSSAWEKARVAVSQAKSVGGAEDLRARRTLDAEQEAYREGLKQRKEKRRHKRSLSIFLCSHKRRKDPKQH